MQDRELRVQPGKAAVAFNRDYQIGGMTKLRDEMNAYWASPARTPVSQYGTKPVYCSAYAYAAHSVDVGMTKQLQIPPTPGFDAATIASKVGDAAIEANCPPAMVVPFADLIKSRTAAALGSFAGGLGCAASTSSHLIRRSLHELTERSTRAERSRLRTLLDQPSRYAFRLACPVALPKARPYRTKT